MRELYEADFHKPGIYGSGRAWANAWDVFPRMPSRVGRGRRAVGDFVCVLGGRIFFPCFFSEYFFFERTRPAASMRPPCLITSILLIVMRHGRGEKRPRPFVAYRQENLFIPGCVQGAHYLVCGSVRACVTFVVFTDCESGTRPISTNPESMEAGRYGLTCLTCFLACRLELDVVAGLLKLSWCVFGRGAVFFCRVFCLQFFFSSNAHGLLQA